MIKTLLIILTMLITLHGCGCLDLEPPEPKPFETSKIGEELHSGRDGKVIKVHKDYILFDSWGSDIDTLVKADRKGMKEILEKGETMDYFDSNDYFNLGNQFYEEVIKTIYSGDDYLVIIPARENRDCCVIDCNKKVSKSITYYKNIKDIPIDYKNFIKIDCSYYFD